MRDLFSEQHSFCKIYPLSVRSAWVMSGLSDSSSVCSDVFSISAMLCASRNRHHVVHLSTGVCVRRSHRRPVFVPCSLQTVADNVRAGSDAQCRVVDDSTFVLRFPSEPTLVLGTVDASSQSVTDLIITVTLKEDDMGRLEVSRIKVCGWPATVTMCAFTMHV